MLHAVTRVLGIAALVALLSGSVLGAAPAQAADDNLGWVRLQPASGKTDVAVLALTQGACPDGRAVTVGLKGPNIPTDNTVGNLVGVTEYKAFDPTLSGQLWIPLSNTFRNWFAVNGVTLKPGAPYTITVVCRDLLRASKTFGTFSSQLVFDAKGGYKALGEAAKPFDTELKPDDPLAIPTPTTSGSASSGSAKPSASSSSRPSGSESPSDDPTGSATSEPDPDATSEAPTTTPDPQDSTTPADGSGGGTAAAAPSAASGTSGPSPFVLVLVGLIIAAGAAWFFQRQRAAAPAAASGRRERTPTDEL